MASFIKKKRFNLNGISFGGRFCGISDKHYRVYHAKMQKHEEKYDNDWMEYYSLDLEEQGIESGVNRRRWHAHNSDWFDEFKDGK